MRDTLRSTDDAEAPRRYEIHIEGHLDDRWAGWFDDLELTRDAAGFTRLSGVVIDQAALHGVLRKIRDLGLVLLAVTPVDS